MKHSTSEAGSTRKSGRQREGGFAILTKDDDFAGMSVLFGAPPKVVHLRAGNIDTSAVAALVLEHATRIAAFEKEPETSLLMLP